MFIGRFDNALSQLWSPQGGIVLITSLHFHHFFSSSGGSLGHTMRSYIYSYHKLEIPFDSITANKSSSKHRSDQNTEERRRCVSTHCSRDIYYICYIGPGRIPGKELYSCVLAFPPPNTRTIGAS